MSRIPRVTGSELLAALATAGFAVIRVRGSHHFVRHEDGRRFNVTGNDGLLGAIDDCGTWFRCSLEMRENIENIE
jgi:predicted RNA binding protein YcfA (HicA-like mRNA interferase family)